MKGTEERAVESAPKVTEEQIRELKAKLSALRGKPLGEIGQGTVCPDCGGKMTVTNDLERAVAVPGIVYVVPRLPGARCQSCGATQLDASGVGILESTVPREIPSDYETAVSRTSGTSLGTYFKMDLARVLNLAGRERLFWKVVDQNLAVVRIQRETRRARSSRRPTPTANRARRVAGRSSKVATRESAIEA